MYNSIEVLKIDEWISRDNEDMIDVTLRYDNSAEVVKEFSPIDWDAFCCKHRKRLKFNK